jgi:hypothetical protein
MTDDLRERHIPYNAVMQEGPVCNWCEMTWPCDAARALDRIARLEAALSEVYDKAPGPWLIGLSEATQAAICEGRQGRSGRGRVTSRKFDQRLKENRDRRAALTSTDKETQG